MPRGMQARKRLRKEVTRSRKRVEAQISATKQPEGPPMVLVKDALDDLRYLEPKRAADRVISALNEAFLRIMALEHVHAPEHDAAKKKR